MTDKEIAQAIRRAELGRTPDAVRRKILRTFGGVDDREESKAIPWEDVIAVRVGVN